MSKSKNKAVKYKAVIYLRLSKEDGDKEESYSISNQRDLALNFISEHPEISLYCELVDDGYTGSNFERPQFQKMIDMVSRGEIDCIIVKDLSRFARDYIGSGYYLEKLFPTMGIRFISINDNIDYLVDDSANTKLIMAFKNVLNDSYIHDISIKIRSQFEIKRKKGEYVGAFVVYGYQKSPDDKHRLVVDKNAAEIVRSIYNQRIHGISANAIAEKLNTHNVPSPAEYKKLCGSNFRANLQKKHEAKWSAKAVIRILTNEIYTGTLIQGKKTTVNYKVKKVVQKEKSEWSIKYNAHEAVISQEQFDVVQKIIGCDTRTMPGKKEPYLFSGFLECADCKASMVRRTAKSGGKTYIYYMCSTNKLGLGCTSHRINENTIYESVMTAVNSYCKNVANLSDRLNNVSFEEIEHEQLARLEDAENEKRNSIRDLERTISVVKQRQRDNLETKEVCKEICADIQAEIDGIRREIDTLTHDKTAVIEEYRKNAVWIKTFSENGNIRELDRCILANLIDKIYVFEDKRVIIRFRYQDRYEQLLNIEKALNVKEAV